MVEEDLMSTDDWKRKLERQEIESREYRHRIYDMIDLENRERVLDVGCGTGAVTKAIAQITRGHVTGIDIDQRKLERAEEYLLDLENVDLIHGDAQELPFGDGEFDLVIFHIVLLYIKDKQKAVNEFARVCEKGGLVVASLEPDYEGHLTYPEDPFREIQLRNARKIGADTKCGRKLQYLFTRAGLETQVGLDQETDYIHIKDPKKKFKMFVDNWWLQERMLGDAGWSQGRIKEYKENISSLIGNGLLFDFPTAFYATGRKD
jgi:ubiquinone/menaquinone biosynthesis C-methylase UbiE